MIGRVLAYLICAIPAAIGVWFVAHFAYTTSDSAADAYNSAFLFGMIAVGAYVCPALALIIGKRNRGGAAFFWLAALLAIAVNWSNTLGAMTNRGAGVEAERSKAAETAREARQRLARVEKQLDQVPPLSVSAAAVSAAEAVVTVAERVRVAECDRRGPQCRQREDDERERRRDLAKILGDKGQSDQRASLTAEANAIRARLTAAPAVKDGNTLGTALARLLPWIDASTASAAQQGLMSLIVELLIAAFLALPELLASPHKTAPRTKLAERPAEMLALAKLRLVSDQLPAFSVAEYAADRLQPSQNGRISVDDLFVDYLALVKKRGVPALALDQFAASFVKLCEGTRVSPIEDRGVIYLANVEFTGSSKGRSKRLGSMARKA